MVKMHVWLERERERERERQEVGVCARKRGINFAGCQRGM